MRLIAFALLASLSAGVLLVSAQAPDARLWQSVLTNYVTEDGNVRYAALKRETALKRFAGQIADVSPDSHPALFPAREDRLAYWLNAYNALVMEAMVTDYPERRDRLSSLLGRGIFFNVMRVRAGGRSMTLNAIETEKLRAGFHDPRIHFAIVCASRGCPWLGRTAFTASNTNALLEDAARRFLSQKRNVDADSGRGVIKLSSIFDWFKSDFGPDDGQRLKFIARYREDGPRLLSRTWKVEYAEWDWSLNDAGR